MHPEHCNEELVGCYPLCEEDNKKVSAIKMNSAKHLIKMKKHPNLGGNNIRLKIWKSQGVTHRLLAYKVGWVYGRRVSTGLVWELGCRVSVGRRPSGGRAVGAHAAAAALFTAFINAS